jgi:hypothetical protein
VKRKEAHNEEGYTQNEEEDICIESEETYEETDMDKVKRHSERGGSTQ